MKVKYFTLSRLYAIVGQALEGDMCIVHVPGQAATFETKEAAEAAIALAPPSLFPPTRTGRLADGGMPIMNLVIGASVDTSADNSL